MNIAANFYYFFKGARTTVKLLNNFRNDLTVKICYRLNKIATKSHRQLRKTFPKESIRLGTTDKEKAKEGQPKIC